MDPKQENEFIKNKFEEFLKKKELTFEEYNKICEEKKQEKIEEINNFLNLAKTKTDLKYLIIARDIVNKAEEKTKETHPEFEFSEEAEEEYILKVFDEIKPKPTDIKQFSPSKDQHFGNYYTYNVYLMMKENPWKVVSYEFFEMNISDNFDEIVELRTDSKLLQGSSLGDIIKIR